MHQPFLTVPNGSRQSGSILIVSLLILLVMTLIGVTGMQTSTLEERMAGNARDSNLCFQAAETALRVGELAENSNAPHNCTLGRYPANDSNCDGGTERTPIWDIPATWDADQNKSVPVVLVNPDDPTPKILAESPRYITEELYLGSESREAGIPSDVTFYRVTAHCYGGTRTAEKMVQSTFQP